MPIPASKHSTARQSAVAITAVALMLIQPAAEAPPERETTSIPALTAGLERVSTTTEMVTASADAPAQVDRVTVSSSPAPEPEPAVEQPPAPEPVRTAEAPTVESRTTDAQEATVAEQPAAQRTESVSNQSPAALSSTPAPAAQSSSVGGVVGAAYAGVGVPYVYGGKGTSGWDCSGFVSWAYAQAGISIPSSTSAIRGSGLFVPTSNPKPGDLVFQNGGGHVGIYVGNGQMIGAQNPSVGTFQHSVTRNPLMGYYTYVG
ncbi:NlpC/P60 family protein (plasmid) [Citricoccus nitrophenolicus]